MAGAARGIVRYNQHVSVHELKIELPESLSEEEAKSFEVGKLTLGQAARMAELSKRAFLEILGRHNVPVFNYPPEDLRRELEL
jgi:predicted HTH domain antitoxin